MLKKTFLLTTLFVVGVVFAFQTTSSPFSKGQVPKGLSLIPNEQQAAKDISLVQINSLGNLEDDVDEFIRVKENYPYLCGRLLKRDITKWQQSNYSPFVADEHWNGKTSQTYYEQSPDGWASSSWNHSASQTLSLPKGKYLLTITARAAAQVSAQMSVTIDGNVLSVDLPNKGNTGRGIDINGYPTVSEDSLYSNDNLGYGWEYRYVEFETTEDNQNVTISLNSYTTEIHQWISLCNPAIYTDSISSIVEPYDEISDAIASQSDVELYFTNDETYPWTISENVLSNGNCGEKYSTSILSMNYKSDYKTELSFDWMSYNSANHSPLVLYVDGVEFANISSSSYSSRRFFIEPGEHIVVFRDSIGNSTNTNNYSNIKNLIVKEVRPLESTILTEKSQPLVFVNNGEWPWTSENGYIQSSNYGCRNSVSRFSTSFTVTKPSKFSFWSSTYYYNDEGKSYGYSGYQYFDFRINGERYMGREYGSGTTSIMLEPGEYTMEWCDSIYNTTSTVMSRLKDVELSSDWVDVELSTPGSLGVEILYKVNVLNDVELLKVTGTLNETDWATIKNCTNLIGLDLTEAMFDAVPNNAFDGMGKLSSVKLPEGVKTIGEYAFRGTQLLNIDIPSSVTSIGQYAFSEIRIRNINFKEDSQLRTIGFRAFYQCSSLSEFIMPKTVTKLRTYNDYDDNDSDTFYECFALKKIVFSDALTYLPNNTCYNCNAIEELHLPNNIVTIGRDFLYGGNQLKKLVFPTTLKSIGADAFAGIHGVDSIVIPESVQSIGTGAFHNSARLSYVELPTGISSYGQIFNGCANIKKIVCHAATPPAVSNDPFSSITKANVTLEVPAFAVVSYKLNNYWYQFGNIIEGENVDYWKVFSELSLTNNRRMDGKPDIDIYYGGKLRVGGNAPMETGYLNYFVNESNPGCLINDCPDMTADSINTIFYVDANKWYFFCPIHDVDLTKVSHSANASYVFRYYDGESRGSNGTGNSWRNVDTGKLKAGQGYIFQCNVSGTISMPADAAVHMQLFNTDDVTTALSAYESTASANKSWNYVGNPYPAYYDIYYMDFTAPITVWTGSTYKAYSIVDDNYVLRPMQAFFVQKPDEIDNIIFHKEGRQFTSNVSRASYAPQRAKSTENANRFLFDFRISNDEDMSDEARVVINDKALCTYEIEKDASKFMSMENGVPQIFTLDNDGNCYAINERPTEDGNVALGYRAAQSGFYTISIVKAAGKILLYDKKMDKTIDLATQDYTFYSDATKAVDDTRFTLIFGNMTPTGISSTENASTSVVASSGCITINGAEGQNVMVFTADGRSVFSGTLKNDALRVDVANGAYIVKVGNSAIKTVVSSK